MKKIFLFFITLTAIIFVNNLPVYSVNEYFKSVNSGSWNTLATWQMSTNSGGSWIAATSTPTETSGLITIQSPNTVTVTVNVNADQLTVNNGGTISINSSILLTILDGAGEDLVLNTGATLSGSGTLQSKGSATILDVHNGANFATALKVNSGFTSVFESLGSLTAYLNGPVTVDAGAVLGAAIGSYTIQFNKSVLVNGTLNGGSGSILRIAGSSMINNGLVVGTYLYFDSVTSVSGTGTFTTRYIVIPFSGNVSLLSDVTFAPSTSFTIYLNGVLNPNTKICNFSAGTFYLRSGAVVSNSGTFQTKGTVTLIIRDGSNFNCPLKVNTGTTTAYDDGSFFTAIFLGTVTTDAGATLKVNTGAYIIQCNNNLTNNGTISGTSGATFRMKGNTLSNTGSITLNNFYFDTTTSVSGSGAYTGNSIFTGAHGNISLTGNVTFSPVTSFILSGALSGGFTFGFAGSSFVNSGNVSVSSFVMETGAHSVQGTGSWSSTINIISGSNVTLNGNFKIRDVNINSGGTLNLSSFKLLASGSNPIINNGTFNASSGSVEYNGASAQNISSSGITYNKLIINNPSGTTLLSNVNVNDTLFMLSGDMNLNGNILTLSSSGYLSETTGNTIGGSTGYVTITKVLNAPSSLNVGGLGAVLTSSSNLGSTVIRRGHTIQIGLSGNTSIARYYDIIPSNNSGLNATLVFRYDESELNGNSEPALSLFSSSDSGASWTVSGGTPDPPGNFITLNSIDSFSRLSAGLSSGVPAQLKLFMEAFYNLSTNQLNMRDTVRAYLRNNTTPFAVVDSAQSVIDSVSFTGSFLFANAPSGIYYIQLQHRNSLETWSRSGGEAYNVGAVLNYDFTTDSTKAFGNNLKEVASKWSMFSGDEDLGGSVNLVDIVDVFNSASLFSAGYVQTDINGDGIVNLNDIVYTYNNSALFAAKATP